MKTTPPTFFFAITVSTILLSTGCQKKTAAGNPNSQSKGVFGDTAKSLPAADLVGYDGAKVIKSVRQTKDANDKHNQDIEKMVENGPDQ